MNSRIERKINSVRSIARRGTFSAALGLGVMMLYPSIASAQEQPNSNDISVYPQCGGRETSGDKTVMVVVSLQEENRIFQEYPVGKKPGQCDNPPYDTSSIVLESFSRSTLSQPDVISTVTRPISCPQGTVSFTLQRLSVVDGLDFKPSSGVIQNAPQPDIHLNVHTDLVSNGSYVTSAQASCKTPEGVDLPGEVLNFAVQIKP